MIGKIKGLGLAFIVIGAMSMTAAAAAPASSVHITTGFNTSIFGQQLGGHKLILEKTNQSLKCSQVLFEGTVPGTGGQIKKEDVTVTSTQTGCTFAGLAATVRVNGCKYTVNGTGQLPLTAEVSIVGCTQTNTKSYGDKSGSGITKPIEIAAAAGCLITVPEQKPLGGHITFTNEGPQFTGTLNAESTILGITYQVHNCLGFATTETRNDAEYVGPSTFDALLDEGSDQVTHNGHQFDKLKQTGLLVGLVAT